MADFPRTLNQTAGMRADARVSYDAGLRSFMLRVYNYLASGLVLSGLIAMAFRYTAASAMLYDTQGPVIVGITPLGWAVTFAPLVLLFVVMFAQNRMSTAMTQLFYWVFVALMGASLSTLLYVYTGASVVRVFFITAAAFAALSLYGYTTKRDLSAWGKFLFMALIGLVIAMVVNFFMQSSGMYYLISGAGVVIFSGLIAYDTQMTRERYYAVRGTDAEGKAIVFSALALYLDFINLMQFLLAFLGDRN